MLSHRLATTPVSVVDVAGKVHHPGVLRLQLLEQPGNRRRAGCRWCPARHSLDTLNLAARVTDGQQVAVGGVAAAPGAADATARGGRWTSTPPHRRAATDLVGRRAGVAKRSEDTGRIEQFTTVNSSTRLAARAGKFAQLKDHVTA